VKLKYVAGLFFALHFMGMAHSAEAPPLAEDPVVEQRLNHISEELRCLVCQNESLAGSRADLAQDLRREIRTLIKDGKTDAEVMEFMVSRYGDFVRYRPPMKPMTWLLWFGPFALLLGALYGLYRLIRRSQTAPAAPAMDATQRAKAQSLLQDTELPP
jgi:cytochrome c-type biogenesis protein CcmH